MAIKVSYHLGDHRHSGRGSIMFSVCPVILTWWCHQHLYNLVFIGLMEMERSNLLSMLTWIPQKERNSLSWSAILKDLQNQEYWFTKSWQRWTGEFRLLQSVMFYKQTRYTWELIRGKSGQNTSENTAAMSLIGQY